MTIHWPASLCWVTQSPSHQSPKTSTRTTSSNCISSPTSIISDRRANTLSRGGELYHPDVFLVASPQADRTPFVCPQVDGGHPQRHRSLQPRSRAEQQRVQSSLSSLTSCPSAVSPGGVRSPASLDSFPLYTYLGHLYTCPCTFGAFYCFNGDMSAGLDCIRDCIFCRFYSQL